MEDLIETYEASLSLVVARLKELREYRNSGKSVLGNREMDNIYNRIRLLVVEKYELMSVIADLRDHIK